MFDVDIRYKQGTDKEKWREIVYIASDYDWTGVNLDSEADFSLTMGDKNLDEFCKKVRELDFVESVEPKKY